MTASISGLSSASSRVICTYFSELTWPNSSASSEAWWASRISSLASGSMVVLDGGKRRAMLSTRASLQREPLFFRKFGQLLPDRDAAGRRVDERHDDSLGLFGVEVEDHGFHRTVPGGGQRQRTIAERDQRQRAERLRRH